ncbi:MAG TPA: ATP-binding protein [Pyrinomonadaceae bacterium]|nr:ATP-binding protein [Pyrinomonadaceae bacterium]
MTPEKRSEKEQGRVVNNRTGGADQPPPARRKRIARRAREQQALAPALPPLLAGLTLLLVLVIGLGVISIGRLQAVSDSVRALQEQSSARLNLLITLSGAVASLNNEARTRSEARARREILPPLSLRLRNARDEVKQLLPKFDVLSAAQTEAGRRLRANLGEFLEITQDLDRYGDEGYPLYRTIDADFDQIIKQLNKGQDDVIEQSAVRQEEAARDIRLLTVLACGLGLIATFGTALEVQRRFRQMRRSLDEARRERQFSTQMVGGMVSAVGALDGDDRIRSANAAFFEIFPEASVGASVQGKIAPPPVMQIIEVLTAQRPTGPTYIGRWKITHLRNADGVARSFDVYTAPLLLDNDEGMIVTLVDVTDAAKAEYELRQRASLAAVGQAVAQVAHEIKNPIGSIRLGISMLHTMIKDSDAVTTINLVERGIEHLNKITQEITHFSRQKPLSRVETDLHVLIKTSLELVADKVREKRTPVEQHFSAEQLKGLWDEDELRQVLVNLFANALEASPAGAPLEISTERVVPKHTAAHLLNGHHAYARIRITDHGSGMDEKTRARIFEPFFTTKKRGTGLGLAVVRKIIDQHEGHLSVTSQAGRGTTFAVELPLSS